MLAAANRLRSPKDIARVYRQGSYGAGGGVLAVKAAKTSRPVTRAVVVVSKKIDKRAVVRNRLRRRLSEIFRHQLETVPPGYDIVITVQADFQSLSESRVSEHLLAALRRVQIIMDK